MTWPIFKYRLYSKCESMSQLYCTSKNNIWSYTAEKPQIIFSIFCARKDFFWDKLWTTRSQNICTAHSHTVANDFPFFVRFFSFFFIVMCSATGTTVIQILVIRLYIKQNITCHNQFTLNVLCITHTNSQSHDCTGTEHAIKKPSEVQLIHKPGVDITQQFGWSCPFKS